MSEKIGLMPKPAPASRRRYEILQVSTKNRDIWNRWSIAFSSDEEALAYCKKADWAEFIHIWQRV